MSEFRREQFTVKITNVNQRIQASPDAEIGDLAVDVACQFEFGDSAKDAAMFADLCEFNGVDGQDELNLGPNAPPPLTPEQLAYYVHLLGIKDIREFDAAYFGHRVSFSIGAKKLCEFADAGVNKFSLSLRDEGNDTPHWALRIQQCPVDPAWVGLLGSHMKRLVSLNVWPNEAVDDTTSNERANDEVI